MKIENSKKKKEEKLFDRDSFAARFKKMRIDRNLKQSDYAEVLNTSIPSISRLEQGTATPDAEIILRIIEKYDCDVLWLLTGKRQRDKSLGPESEVVMRDLNIHNQLKTQRDGMQEIVDQVADDKGGKSRSANLIRDKLAYLDALLDIGCDHDE